MYGLVVVIRLSITELSSKIAKNVDIHAKVQSLKDTEWKLVRSGADDHSTHVLARSHHACSDSVQKSAPSGVGAV
jgi:hypothetical protein